MKTIPEITALFTPIKGFRLALTNFERYVRQPSYRQPSADLSTHQSPTVIPRFLGEYPLLFVLFFTTIGSVLLMNFTTGHNVYAQSIRPRHMSPVVISMALLLASLIEEALFRAILRLTRNRLRFMAALLVFIGVGIGYNLVKKALGDMALLWTIISWGSLTFLVDVYVKQSAVFARINLIWQRHFRIVFYAITSLYAFVKLSDEVFTLVNWQCLLLPILVGVSLSNSSYFGYVRMKYGFWYAVAVHTLLLVASLIAEIIRTL